MKHSDYLLSPETQARIKAAEILLSICKSQMRNPDSAIVLAFAQHSHDLQVKIAKWRRESLSHQAASKVSAKSKATRSALASTEQM